MGMVNFMRGVAIGFSIAAPVGPIAILCIRRTLTDGWLMGLISGLGAATADMIYGGVAAFGLRAVSDFLLIQHVWFRILGGLFLIFLGIRIALSNPTEGKNYNSGKSVPGTFLTTLILTLSNPVTILSFAAIYSGFGFGYQIESITESTWMIFGVFLGSSLWWVILSGVVGILRSRFTKPLLMWINRFSGGAITVFGIVIVLAVLKPEISGW
jgi:threonine/homoserine/homoserine lactone efflux protein